MNQFLQHNILIKLVYLFRIGTRINTDNHGLLSYKINLTTLQFTD